MTNDTIIKEAQRALITAKEADLIARSGCCPHYWGHFDITSCLVGFFIGGVFAIILIAILLGIHR